MASINTRDEMAISTSTGILHPASANRFRVLLNGSSALAGQVTSVLANMVDRTITVRIEQPIGLASEILSEIDALCMRSIVSNEAAPFKFPFTIELLDGACTVHSKISGFAHVTKHEFVLDYASSRLAEHVLTLHYTAAAQ